MELLEKPLDRHVRLASFKARIFHDGQISGASFSNVLEMPRDSVTMHQRASSHSYANDPKERVTKSYECEASRDQTPSVFNTTGEHEPKNGERPSGTESLVNTSHTTRVVNTAVEKKM